MSNKYNTELYEKIKNSFADTKKSGFKNILKTVPENIYKVRILPNVDNPESTLFRYFQHGWVSPIDGRYTSTLCPTTYDEECPICTERFRLYNKGDDESKELSKTLARKERYYANILVVDDPVNPDNNGTVKILGYGAQIKKVIEEGMSGDDAEDVGGRMFDFSKEGCNLRIKVEKNKAGFPNYDRSKFLKPSAVTVTMEDALEEAHDFEPLLNRKSTAEMKSMMETSLYGTSTTTEAKAPETVVTATPVDVKNIVDDIPMDFADPDDSDIATTADDIMSQFDAM